MSIAAFTEPTQKQLRVIFRAALDIYPSGNRQDVARWWTGWAAVVMSTALACFWAFWGSIENFHEGWYFREWYRNVGLALVQYLPWMFVPMGAALTGLWNRWLGFLIHLAFAAAAVSLFGPASFGGRFVALPIALLGVLCLVGRPTPIRWARLLLVVAPLLTAVISGAHPAWRVFTRPGTVVTGPLHITRGEIDITWTQVGPGWGHGVTWDEASRRCAMLTDDGAQFGASPVNTWRLPTVGEAARSMNYRGGDAGAQWDSRTRRVSFRREPDKEAPLWNPFSHVIYLWTSTERDTQFAYYIAFNGGAYARRKDFHPEYQGYRCVKAGGT